MESESGETMKTTSVGGLLKGKAKVPKRLTESFLKSYTQQWPFLTQSRQGASMVQGSVCNAEFSRAHRGNTDCERHVTSDTHKFLKCIVVLFLIVYLFIYAKDFNSIT